MAANHKLYILCNKPGSANCIQLAIEVYFKLAYFLIAITMNTIKRSVAENEYSNATSLGFGNPSVIEDNDDIEMAKLKEKDPKKEEEEEEEEMSLSERAREKEKEALQSEEESKSV